jgi:cation transport ATPase
MADKTTPVKLPGTNLTPDDHQVAAILSAAGWQNKEIAAYITQSGRKTSESAVHRLVQQAKLSKAELATFNDKTECRILRLARVKIAAAILESPTPLIESMKDIREAATSIGILIDKERLITGKATHIFKMEDYLKDSKELQAIQADINEITMQMQADGSYAPEDSDSKDTEG